MVFAGEDEEPFASVKVLVKELDDVLLRDVGDRIKNSGRYYHHRHHHHNLGTQKISISCNFIFHHLTRFFFWQRCILPVALGLNHKRRVASSAGTWYAW